MFNKILINLVTVFSVLLIPNTVMAHVSVQPDEVGIGKSQVFTISVPSEKEVPTIGIRIILPSNLQEVMPTVKTGWKINTKSTSKAGEESVTEISWSGGSIPPEQRDEFSFSAQVPSETTILQWKAYQTYKDGSVVSWDQPPTGSDDAEGDKGPYSTTDVLNDLDSTNDENSNSQQLGPYIIASLALVIAVSVFVVKRK